MFFVEAMAIWLLVKQNYDDRAIQANQDSQTHYNTICKINRNFAQVNLNMFKEKCY